MLLTRKQAAQRTLDLEGPFSSRSSVSRLLLRSSALTLRSRWDTCQNATQPHRDSSWARLTLLTTANTGTPDLHPGSTDWQEMPTKQRQGKLLHTVHCHWICVVHRNKLKYKLQSVHNIAQVNWKSKLFTPTGFRIYKLYDDWYWLPSHWNRIVEYKWVFLMRRHYSLDVQINLARLETALLTSWAYLYTLFSWLLRVALGLERLLGCGIGRFSELVQ